MTTGAVRRAKLQSNHHQQTNIQLFPGRMPFLSPNQQCQSTERKYDQLVNQSVSQSVINPLSILTAIFQVDLT